MKIFLSDNHLKNIEVDRPLACMLIIGLLTAMFCVVTTDPRMCTEESQNTLSILIFIGLGSCIICFIVFLRILYLNKREAKRNWQNHIDAIQNAQNREE